MSGTGTKLTPRRTANCLRPVAVACVCLSLGSLTAEGRFGRKRARYRLKVATLAPAMSVWGRAYKAFGDELADLTDGAVRLRVYAGGVQGDEATVIRKMRIGQLDGAGFLGRGVTLICRDTNVLQLPLLFRSHAEVDAVMPSVTPFLERKARDSGYEVLGWPEVGFSYLFSRDPVRSLADVRRAKPWLLKDDVFSEVFYECGGMTAVPAEVGDVLTGLRSGLLRTVFSPPAGMVALQWHSRVSYRLDLEIMFSVGALILRAETWERLPPDVRETVRSASVRHVAELNRKVRKLNQDALDAMAKEGIRTLTATPASVAEFRKLNETVTHKLSRTSFSPEAYSLLRTALNAYRTDGTEAGK